MISHSCPSLLLRVAVLQGLLLLCWLPGYHAWISSSSTASSSSSSSSSIFMSSSFSNIQSQKRRFHHTTLHHSAASDVDTSTITVAPLGNDDPTLAKAAEFFADSYWLGTPHVQDLSSPNNAVTDGIRQQLVQRQSEDFWEKYGERVGQRRLDVGLWAALQDGHMVGLVGLETCLLVRDNNNDNNINILSPDESEQALQQAVSVLGPKDRRAFRKASATEIAQQLLQQQQVVAVLCNLVVAPSARGRGIARRLCQAVEHTVTRRDDMTHLYLQVEGDNAAAVQLYTTKLGYRQFGVRPDADAVRFHPGDGSFSTTPVDTLILVKDLAAGPVE